MSFDVQDFQPLDLEGNRKRRQSEAKKRNKANRRRRLSSLVPGSDANHVLGRVKQGKVCSICSTDLLQVN